ncbi:MAG: ABC transporter ATP-binding protein [Microthrixaceae bacterium]
MTSIAHAAEPAPEDEISDEWTADPTQRSTVGEGLRLIARFVRVQPRSFALSLLGGIGWSLLVVGATFILGRVTDKVITPAFDVGVGGGTVLWAMFALWLVAVLRGLSVVMRRWYGSVTETINQAEMRRQVSHRLLMMPLSSYRRHQTGQLLANADVDITTATRLLMPLPFSIGVIALAFFALISLLLADVYFALVALVLFPLLALLSRFYTSRVSGPAAEVQARLGAVASIAHESFDGALTVKTLGRQSHEVERFTDASAEVRRERLRVAALTSVFEPMIQMLPNLGMIVLLLVGAWRVDSGAATPGQLVQAVALFGWLAFPMRIVGFMFESLPMSVVSARRVDRVLAERVDLRRGRRNRIGDSDWSWPASGAEQGGQGSRGLGLSIDGVSFSYEADSVGPDSVGPDSVGPGGDAGASGEGDSDSGGLLTRTGSVPCSPSTDLDQHPAVDSPLVLDGVTFGVAAGEVVALVGPTGSGKSTLINLLLRLDEPDEGVISLGGVPIAELDPDELRDAVTVAFQESFLFATSIEGNVSMGRPLGSKAFDDALERASADGFVAELPQQSGTVVGERGVTLSGGQRQRVALARALARKPKVLLLDDATSAVDPVIEADILRRLRDGDTTMIVVAHRLSTILLADRVVHLDDGRVAGIGTHDELLANPDYAALVHAYEDNDGDGDGDDDGVVGVGVNP